MSNRIAARELPLAFASVAVLCCGSALVAQQSTGTQDATPSPEAVSAPVTESEAAVSDSAESLSQVDLDSGELTQPPKTDIVQLLQERRERQGYIDGEDAYTLNGMFGKAHGQFILDYERFRPNIGLWGGGQSSAGLSGEQGKFSFWEIGTGQQGKIVSGPDTFLTYGGLFNMRDYDFEEVTGIADMRLYAMFIDMGGGRFLSDDVLLEAHFQPGLATDFGGTITSNQWKWFGDIIGTWRANESLYWKFGVRADATFEETPAYPVLGVAWLIDPQWRLDVVAPRSAELSWMPVPEFMVRGGLSLQGMDYGYHRTTGAGGTQNNLDARTQEFRVYLDGVWRAADLSSFTLRVGGTLAGWYDIERPAGAGNYSGQVDPAFFLQFNFGASF